MAPALIEAAGVASRDRQSNSCNKIQQTCLAGKRLFDLKHQKYLLREAKISAKVTLLTDIPPRVVGPVDFNSTTNSALQFDINDNVTQRIGIIQSPANSTCTVVKSREDTCKVVTKDSDMNNSDNGNASCVVDGETKLDRNCTVMSDIQMNTSKKDLVVSPTERHVVAVDKKTLTTLKRRKDRRHEKLKELEQRIELLTSRIRTVQFQRISSHVERQLVESSERDVTSKAALNGSNDSSKVLKQKDSFPDGKQASRNLTSANDDTRTESVSIDTDESIQILLHRSKLCRSLLDPDATDSETEDDDALDDRGVHIKRSNSVWWKDRAHIGSRCSWLESRVADIDQKLKKYEDISRLLGNRRIPLFASVDLSQDESKIPTDNTPHVVGEVGSLRTADSKNRKNGMLRCLGSKQTNRGPDIDLPEHMCSRTIPLQSAPVHKYLKVSRNEKPNHLGYTCPSLPAIDTCMMCQKANVSNNTMVAGNARAAALDHCYHTKLSFENDILLPGHLEATLRQGGLDTKIKPLNNKIFARKREQEKKRSTSRVALNNLVAAAKAAKIKLSGHGLSQSLPAKLSSRSNLDNNKKRSAAISAANQIEKKARKLTVPRESTSRIPYSSSDNHGLSQSQSSVNLSQIVKKKRPSSAFDINNIVIPYSIACATRVEKLKYKEIPTPGWRSLDSVPVPKVLKLDPDDDLDEETTSDDSYALRHSVCELEERKRFSVFFQPLRRSRSSRRSSECNTPEPHSPTSNDEGKTIAPPVSTPTDLGQPWVTSGKSGGRNLLWTQLKPEENAVPPWPKRGFPLNDDEICELEVSNAESNESNEAEGTCKEDSCSPPLESTVPKRVSSASSGDSGSPSPENRFTPIDEIDPTPPVKNDIDELDDESWTVKLVSSEKTTEHTGKNRKGIVLKLAKK